MNWQTIKEQHVLARTLSWGKVTPALLAVALLGWLGAFTFELSSLGSLALVLLAMMSTLAWIKISQQTNIIKALAIENERMADQLWLRSEGTALTSELFDQLGDLVVLFDEHRVITDCNHNFANALQKQKPNIIGKTLGSLGIDVAHKASNFDPNPIHVHIAGRWYSWALLPSGLVNERSPRIVRGVARDIHQHKSSEKLLVEAREKAEAANIAKSQFLATVSHEIRTPLNGITGMSRLLSDTPLSAEQKTYVDAVSASGNALMSLIEDLLDFSKIEAGRMDLHPEHIDLRVFCESLVELVAHRALAKQISISVWVSPEVPEFFLADPDRLRQSLLNLLGNAIKFTDSGGLSLEVTTENQSLVLCVTDTGHGIHNADLERIFEQFEQVDGGNTRRNAGVGLGLSITRKLIEAMGGEIAVNSIVNEGSVFSIHLPMTGNLRSNYEQPLKGKSVVLALNSPIEAQTLAKIIESNGGTSSLSQTGNQFDFPKVAAKTSLLIDVKTMRQCLQSGADVSEFSQRIILIEPSERGSLGEFQKLGFETYLVNPVRQKTLVRVLSMQPLTAHNTIQQNNSPHRVPALGKSLSILVAEDNEINALMVKSALLRAGHKVMVVGDGRSAVNEVAAHPYQHDLVLMDLHMPVMDGLDAIAAIRNGEDELGLKHLPILALTADGQSEVEKAVRSVGGNGYITKPVDPARLIGLIEETAGLEGLRTQESLKHHRAV